MSIAVNRFEQLLGTIDSSEFADRYWLDRAGVFHPDRTLLEPLYSDSHLLDPENLILLGHDRYRIVLDAVGLVRRGDGHQAREAWRSESRVTLVAEATQFALESVRSYFLALVNDIGVPFRWSWPNVYYSRSGSGITRHWDNHENFIVGLRGRKRFVVAPNGCMAYPHQNADEILPHIKGLEKEIEAERTAPTLPGMFHMDLEPGDCVFIPRGWWHQASALDDYSTTLTWALWTYTWEDLLTAGEIEVPSSATPLVLRTPVSLDGNKIPAELGLPSALSKAISLVRAQAELRSVAEVTKNLSARTE